MADNVGDIMTRDVVFFKEDDGVIGIARSMRDRKISGVIIMRGNTPVGIITEKDMTAKVVAGEMDLRSTKAKDIMSSPVRVIPPDTSVFVASQLMKKAGYKRLPVFDKHKLVGIITQSDILRYFGEIRKQFVLEALKGGNKKLSKPEDYPG